MTTKRTEPYGATEADSSAMPFGQALVWFAAWLRHSAICTQHSSFEELHHFCTVSSPILACLRKSTLNYQPFSKIIAPRHFVPVAAIFPPKLALPLHPGRPITAPR